MLSIELPYPPRTLSPNSRCHWAVKWKAARVMKEAAFFATKQALAGGAYLGGYTYRILAYPPSKHQRDQDNLIASLKASLDSIAQALEVDDCQFVCGGVEWREPVKYGKIIIEMS